jgi:hypothetical protein
MRGWAWLGVVLPLLWFVGSGGWLWMSSVGDRDEWYSLQLQRCYSSSSIDREKLRTDDEQYDQKIADISREYYSCTERAKAIFDRQMDERRSHVGKIIVGNAEVLAAIWFLVWIAVMMRRWARARAHFRKQGW